MSAPKFKIECRQEGTGKPTVTKFDTLAAAAEYVSSRWQGAEYVDGPDGFHTDFSSYILHGFTLADIGTFSREDGEREFRFNRPNDCKPRELGQHTPGPWRVAPDPIRKHLHPFHGIRHVTTDHTWGNVDHDRESYGFDRESGGAIICDLRDNVDHMEANARLIAAAPELLEVATYAAGAMGDAMGTPAGWDRDPEVAAYIRTLRGIIMTGADKARAAIAKAGGAS